MVQQSNLYGTQNSFKQEPMDNLDLYRLIRFLFYSSLCKLPCKSDYWSVSFGSEVIMKNITRNRVNELLRSLHFGDNILQTQPADKTQPLIELFNSRCDSVVEQKQKFSIIIGKKEIVVDQQVVNMYPRVTDFLRVKGYNIKESLGAVKISSRRSLGGAPPVIYLDGTRLVAETSAASSPPPSQAQGNGFGGSVKTPETPVADPFQESGSFSFLYELYTAEIDRIEVNPRPDVTEGVNGAGGVIKIWTRRTPLVPTDATAMNKSFIDTTHGFDVPKKFYTPKYIYTNSLFEYTGPIHWEPQLEFNNTGKATFNIADTGTENISFFSAQN